MKKIIAVALAAFALNASAFSGNGNDNIESARSYLYIKHNDAYGDSRKVPQSFYWSGVVMGLSDAFSNLNYKNAICYPEGTTAGQLAELAANYLIDNVDQRQQSLNVLVWISQAEAFGFMSDESCWNHDLWLEYNG